MNDFIIEEAKKIKEHCPDFDMAGVINIAKTSKNENEAIIRYGNYITDYYCKYLDEKVLSGDCKWPIVPSYMVGRPYLTDFINKRIDN